MRTSGCSRAQQGWQHAGRVKCDECAIILLYCVVSGRVALFNGISHINLRSPTNRPTNRESAAPKSTAAAAFAALALSLLCLWLSRLRRRRSYVSSPSVLLRVENHLVFCRLHGMWGKIADKMPIKLVYYNGLLLQKLPCEL